MKATYEEDAMHVVVGMGVSGGGLFPSDATVCDCFDVAQDPPIA